jgi:NhaA family Na+:H+ antiporter
MWFFMLRSGIHPTITGVLLAFAIPFGNGDERSPSYGLQHRLHYPVAFFILPVFALANTGIAIPGGWAEGLLAANSLGIMLGLLLRKPVGIVLFSLLGVGLGWYTLPKDMPKVAVLGPGYWRASALPCPSSSPCWPSRRVRSSLVPRSPCWPHR